MGTPATPRMRGWSGAIVLLLMVLLLAARTGQCPPSPQRYIPVKAKSTGPH